MSKELTTGELLNCVKTPKESCEGCYALEHCKVSTPHKLDSKVEEALEELAPYSKLLRSQLIEALDNNEIIREPYKTKILAYNTIKQAFTDMQKELSLKQDAISTAMSSYSVVVGENKELQSKLDKIELVVKEMHEPKSGTYTPIHFYTKRLKKILKDVVK